MTNASIEKTVGSAGTADSPIAKRFARVFGIIDSATHVAAIDGLRAFAMTLVFLAHFHTLFQQWLPPGTASAAIAEFLAFAGHRGVCLFLVISGFFVYRNFVFGNAAYGAFLRGRVTRLYPTYWAVLVLYLVLFVLFPSASKLPDGIMTAGLHIATNLLLLPGLLPIQPLVTVSWTLTFLILFYAAAPLLIRAARLRVLRAWQRATAIGIAAVLWLSLCSRISNSLLHPRMVMFLVGMLAAEMLQWAGFRALLQRCGDALGALPLAAGMAALYGMRWRVFDFIPSLRENEMEYFQIVLGIALFWFTAQCVSSTGWLASLFSALPMRCMGRMSYSYYLIHGLALKALATVYAVAVARHPWLVAASSYWAMMLLCYATTQGVACTWYLLIERRFARTMTSCKATSGKASATSFMKITRRMPQGSPVRPVGRG